MTEVDNLSPLIVQAARIVVVYLRHNAVSPGEIPALLASVHGALHEGRRADRVANVDSVPLKPRISIRRTITSEYLISLEDGQPYKSLKRHLAVRGLTPEQYRAKWGLPVDYPMVALAYSEARSKLAKQAGLGRKPSAPVELSHVRQKRSGKVGWQSGR